MRTEILVKLPQYDAPATQTARRSNSTQEQNTLGTGRETDLVYTQAKRKTVDILLCALLISFFFRTSQSSSLFCGRIRTPSYVVVVA